MASDAWVSQNPLGGATSQGCHSRLPSLVCTGGLMAISRCLFTKVWQKCSRGISYSALPTMQYTPLLGVWLWMTAPSPQAAGFLWAYVNDNCIGARSPLVQVKGWGAIPSVSGEVSISCALSQQMFKLAANQAQSHFQNAGLVHIMLSTDDTLMTKCWCWHQGWWPAFAVVEPPTTMTPAVALLVKHTWGDPMKSQPFRKAVCVWHPALGLFRPLPFASSYEPMWVLNIFNISAAAASKEHSWREGGVKIGHRNF